MASTQTPSPSKLFIDSSVLIAASISLPGPRMVSTAGGVHWWHEYCRVKVRDVIKRIEEDGWYLIAQSGSRRQYKHPIKLGRVTIDGHPSHDLPPGTLNSILKQAKRRRRSH
jgi:predicted RNA binding protein YcfA (HicA-like mRNA interferase family)